MLEAEMRSRGRVVPANTSRLTRGQKQAISRAGQQPPELKRRIAALVLIVSRDWSADQVAKQFGWSKADVDRWISAGAPLL